MKQFKTTLQEAPTSHEMFTMNGQYLPCVYTAYGDQAQDWFISDTYYPAYFKIIDHIVRTLNRNITVLEIGVKTGYIGAVLARVLQQDHLQHLQGHYVGVDIGEYIPDGLSLASQTFTALANMSASLIEGDSTSPSIKDLIRSNGPYDIIHIDGAHEYDPKVSDLLIASDTLKKDGWVLVDDYDYCREVKPAVTHVLDSNIYSVCEYYPTLRGMALLQL